MIRTKRKEKAKAWKEEKKNRAPHICAPNPSRPSLYGIAKLETINRRQWEICDERRKKEQNNSDAHDE
jgi:hypothetical protein